MRSLRRDPAVLQDQDARGAADGRQPVGDDDRRPARPSPAQGVEHRRLGDRVHGGGRLVENQDRRVLQQRPREAETLPLAAGEGGSRLVDRGAVAPRQAGDGVMDLRVARRPLDLRVRGVEPPVADVVGDRAGEEQRVLGHQGDPLAQRAETVGGGVAPVEQHAPGRRREEPRDQVREGGLAGPGRADDGHQLAGPRVEADAVEDGARAVVREPDRLEADVPGQAAGVRRVRRIADLRLQRQDVAHPAGPDHRLLQCAHGVGDLGDRVVDPRQVGGDDEQLADGQRPVDDAQAADDENGGGAGQRHRGHGQREERLPPGEAHPRPRGVAAGAGEAAELAPFAGEALDRGDRPQRLPGPFDQPRFQHLDLLGPLAQGRRVVAQAEVQERRHGQRQQREGRVEGQDHGEHHAQMQRREGDGQRAAGDQVVDAVRVGVQPVHRVRRAVGEVVPEGQRLQVLQQADPQVVDHPLAHVHLDLGMRQADRLRGQLDEQAAAGEQRQQGDRAQVGGERKEGDQRGGKRPVAEHAVHDQLQRPRRRGDEADLDQRQPQDGADARAVGPEEGRRPAEQGHGVSVYVRRRRAARPRPGRRRGLLE